MAKGIKITGIDALSKKLKENATLNDVKYFVKKNGAELNANAQRKAPIDTGFMKKSIVMSLADGGFTVKVTAGAEYAGYVEYGTRFMSAQPFMRPSLNKQKVQFKKDMERLFK